jgi:NAD(P)H-flavin reductase/hemoglobin-like flavoprotein
MPGERLKRSWEAVAVHGDQVPLFFYSTLFLTHPDIRQLFPVSMAGQRDKLVAALGRIVSQVDDLDRVRPFVEQLGRDHRRFSVVHDHYPAVGHALLRTLAHFSGPDWSDDLAREWEDAYARVARAMLDAAGAATGTPPWWDAEIVAHERRTLDVAVLTVRPDGDLPYRAGQSVAVETPLRPRLWRYYSPATLPGADGTFQLHVRIVPGGPVSSALVQGTQKGDLLRMGAPVGRALTLDDSDGCDLVLVAGGTGLAPMKALVEEVQDEAAGRQVDLFWGVRQHRELYDLPAVQALAGRHDWLRLVPCVSEEEAGGTVETGDVVDVALRHGSWPGREVYVCGSPEMVRGSVAALRDAGGDPGRLHVEEFGSEETGHE